MTAITFIEQPPFVVDFGQYASRYASGEAQESFSTTQKIKHAVAFALNCLKHLFVSFGQAFYETAKYSGISFKYIVLGAYDNAYIRFTNPALMLIKLGVWVLGMGWCVVATTGRLWLEKVTSKTFDSELKNYASSEINLVHLKTDDLALDASGVPATISVSSLSTIFDEVNFDDPRAPGYMSASSRVESGTTYSKEKLREYLETFIRRVNARESFLGTPPGYDIPRLMAFYKQIEDAVRLSIHEIEGKLAKFRQINGNNYSAYDETQKNAYKDILEDRARIVIDLAIAGNHCGARYMGDSMTTYNYTVRGEASSNDKNLEDTLVDILAQKRKTIAEGQIQRHLGHDTHAFARYMGSLGESLAIPGTKNVIEHLSSPLDKSRYQQLFFEEYTVDAIIDAIQEKVKSSASFRSKISDWIRDQMGSWNSLGEEEDQRWKETLSAEIIKVIQRPNAPSNGSVTITPIQNLQRLLAHLKESNPPVELPNMEEGWDEFITELLVLGKAKDWCNQNLPGDQSPLANMTKRNNFKIGCQERVLGSDLVSRLKEEVIHNGLFNLESVSGDNHSEKIDEIRGLFRNAYPKLPAPENDTIQKVISGEANLEDVIDGFSVSMHGNEFIEALNLDDIGSNGLSPELLEWILVSQNILLPQNNVPQDVIATNEVSSLIETILTNYESAGTRHLPEVRYWLESFHQCSQEEIENEAATILRSFPEFSGARYRFGESNRELLLKNIFRTSFINNPEAVTRAIETVVPLTGYYRLKKITHIQIPRCIEAVTGSEFFKVTTCIAAIATTAFAGMAIYPIAQNFTAAKIVPFVINNTPLQVIKVANCALNCFSLMEDYIVIFCLSLYGFQLIFNIIPEIPFVTRAIQSISSWNIFWRFISMQQTAFGFFFELAMDMSVFSYNIGNVIADNCGAIAHGAEVERLRLNKDRAFALWLRELNPPVIGMA